MNFLRKFLGVFATTLALFFGFSAAQTQPFVPGTVPQTVITQPRTSCFDTHNIAFYQGQSTHLFSTLSAARGDTFRIFNDGATNSTKIFSYNPFGAISATTTPTSPDAFFPNFGFKSNIKPAGIDTVFVAYQNSPSVMAGSAPTRAQRAGQIVYNIRRRAALTQPGSTRYSYLAFSPTTPGGIPGNTNLTLQFPQNRPRTDRNQFLCTNIFIARCGDGVVDNLDKSAGSFDGKDGISTEIGNIPRRVAESRIIDESCDDGAANSNTKPGACRTDCSGRVPVPQTEGIAIDKQQKHADTQFYTDDPLDLTFGDEIHYVITVQNTGQTRLTLRIQDIFPAGFSFWGFIGFIGFNERSIGFTNNTQNFFTHFFTLAPREFAIIAITGTAQQNFQTLTNTAIAVKANGKEMGRDTVFATLGGPEMKLDKSLLNPQPDYQSGDRAEFLITLDNIGTRNLTGVLLQDFLPTGKKFLSGTRSSTCPINFLPGDTPFDPVDGIPDTPSPTKRAAAPAPFPRKSQGTLTATRSGAQEILGRGIAEQISPKCRVTFRVSVITTNQIAPDLATRRNLALATAANFPDQTAIADLPHTPIPPQTGELSIQKNIQNFQTNGYSSGDIITYQITLSNISSIDLTGIIFQDLFPRGVQFLTGSRRSNFGVNFIPGIDPRDPVDGIPDTPSPTKRAGTTAPPTPPTPSPGTTAGTVAIGSSGGNTLIGRWPAQVFPPNGEIIFIITGRVLDTMRSGSDFRRNFAFGFASNASGVQDFADFFPREDESPTPITGDIIRTKTTQDSTIFTGETITFDLQLQNQTNATIQNISIQDILPNCLSLESASSNGTQQTGSTTRTFPDLTPNATLNFSLTARASTSSSCVWSHSNTGISRFRRNNDSGTLTDTAPFTILARTGNGDWSGWGGWGRRGGRLRIGGPIGWRGSIGTNNPPSCHRTNTTVSANLEEILPFRRSANLDTSNITPGDSCDGPNTIPVESIQCHFALYKNQTTSPVLTRDTECIQDARDGRKIFEYFLTNFQDARENAVGRFMLPLRPSIFAGQELGEYKLSLERIEFDTCDNNNQKISGTPIQKVCEVNVAITRPYLLQRNAFGFTPQNSTLNLDGITTLNNDPITARTDRANISVQNFSYFDPQADLENQIQNFINEFAPRATIMADQSITNSLAGGQNISIRKVPGQNIFFFDSQGASKFRISEQSFFNAPFTLVVRGMDLIIEGSITQNHGLFIVQDGQIWFDETRCDSRQEVKGIFLAQNGFRSNFSTRNDDLSQSRCPHGSLLVRGILLGAGIENLTQSRRSHLNTRFNTTATTPAAIAAERRELLFDGAALAIEYYPPLRENTVPGRDFFSTTLSKFQK